MGLMRMASAGAVVLWAAMLGGCCGKSFTALDMTVGPPPVVNASSNTYKVDIVGVSDADANEIEKINPSMWFGSGGAEMRRKFKDATWSTEIRAGSGGQTLARKNEIWEKWRSKKVKKLHVIADPPPGAGGDSASWTRDIAPMSKTWENDEIKVYVDSAGVRLDRNPLPEKE